MISSTTPSPLPPPAPSKFELSRYWSLIFVIGFLLLWHFANLEPQEYIAAWYMRLAWASAAAFLVAIGWSKWKLGAFFSNRTRRDV